MLLLNLLVLGKILQKALLSDAVQKIRLLVVMLGQHHVQHDVSNRVQQLRHVLSKDMLGSWKQFQAISLLT